MGWDGKEGSSELLCHCFLEGCERSWKIVLLVGVSVESGELTASSRMFLFLLCSVY
jgi:hypothetical protein